MPTFECDQCGACCAGHLIVEADALDVLRQPQILQADPNWAEQSVDEVVDRFQNDIGLAVIVACGTNRPCPFLDAESRCSIYPTRPNDCVAMQAGSEQCQQARDAAGLPALEPANTAAEPPQRTSCPVSSSTDRLEQANAELQAHYHEEYLKQMRLRACPGCGDTDIF